MATKKPAAKKKAAPARLKAPANRQKTGKGGKRSTSFKPGQSGNPSGRPVKTEEQKTLEAMCRERTPQALATVLGIMDLGENERNRLSAAQFVIERGWGKAAQSVEVSGPNGGPIQSVHDLSIDALMAIASGKA